MSEQYDREQFNELLVKLGFPKEEVTDWNIQDMTLTLTKVYFDELKNHHTPKDTPIEILQQVSLMKDYIQIRMAYDSCIPHEHIKQDLFDLIDNIAHQVTHSRHILDNKTDNQLWLISNTCMIAITLSVEHMLKDYTKVQ